MTHVTCKDETLMNWLHGELQKSHWGVILGFFERDVTAHCLNDFLTDYHTKTWITLGFQELFRSGRLVSWDKEMFLSRDAPCVAIHLHQLYHQKVFFVVKWGTESDLSFKCRLKDGFSQIDQDKFQSILVSLALTWHMAGRHILVVLWTSKHLSCMSIPILVFFVLKN